MCTQSAQTTLGLGPVVLPSRRGSLAEAFGTEGAWQAHLVEDASLLESILGRPIDDVESAPYVAGLRPDLALDVDGYQVLVELQLGSTDPRHLGQVWRYQRSGGADAVLWLAEEVRHDYVDHVLDLNRWGDARVALAEVATLRVAGGWTFTARLVAERLSLRDWDFAYQSQGMTEDKWLGPTVESMLDNCSGPVVLAPVGFVSDHVEILYDVDILFREYAAQKGIDLRRPESLNDSPKFIDTLAAVARGKLL